MDGGSGTHVVLRPPVRETMGEQTETRAERPLVLVVDDSRTVAHLLAQMLRSGGYDTHVTEDGEAALDWLEGNVPDACLLDIKLPGLDGYEVCRRIKASARTADVPVIFISGLHSVDGIAEAFAAGGVDYVVKPPRAPEVLARVGTHLRLRQLHRQLENKNRDLTESYARLREAEQLRDDLMHMVVHDMRSPLTGILMTLDSVLHSSSGALAEYDVVTLQHALTATERLTEMVTSLLDVTRLEEGKLPVHCRSHSLPSLLDEAVASLGGAASSERLRVEVGPGAVEASCDRVLVQRILSNLISNALQFSPADQPIQIQIDGSPDEAKVAVVDRGPGVAPEDRERIFEKYRQGRTGDLSGRRSGSGLGLAFCRLAVEAMGGRIGLESEPGHGATFWFTLPRS